MDVGDGGSVAVGGAGACVGSEMVGELTPFSCPTLLALFTPK